ncbi:MAG: hypothetical protein ACKOPE_03975 [Novosphingobium sp.]
MLAALLLLASAPAAPISADAVATLDPNTMTLEEIRAHNQRVGNGSPEFIRCRKFQTTGSLARTRKVCRSAREWAAADATGSQEAQDIVRKWQQSEGSNSMEDPQDVGRAIGPGGN